MDSEQNAQSNNLKISYFQKQDNQFQNCLIEKTKLYLTQANDQSIEHQLNFQSSQNPLIKKSQVPIQFRSQKNFIRINNKQKILYQKAKQGKNSQTNDLSINTGSLFKTFCNQFLYFQKANSNQMKLIEQFKVSAFNLGQFQKLLAKSEIQDDDRKTKNSIGQFFSSKVSEPKTIARVFKSKKMNFNNKLIMLKYMQKIKKGCENPNDFTSWKTNNF